MKRIVQYVPVFLMLALFGCATKTTDTQTGAMERLSDSRHQMDQVRGQIERTTYSLDNLMRAPAAEIKNAQNQYAGDVKTLRKMSDQLDTDAKTMRERRIEYLTEWERAQLNVENPQLKRSTEQRKNEVTQNLANAESALRNANQSIEPLVAELEDIEQVTGNDPTPAGIAAVKKSGVVQTARRHANTANSRLDLAASRFDRALAALSPQPGTKPVRAAAAPAAPAAPAAAAAPAAPSAPAVAALPSFTQADRNADGAIELDEAGQIPGLDFSAADRNKDGKLSREEYEAAVKSKAPIGGSTSPPPTR